MSKRQFALTVLAYLTGWVIAQALFNRVWTYVMREQRDESFKIMAHDVACAVVDVMEARNPQLQREREDYRREIARLRNMREFRERLPGGKRDEEEGMGTKGSWVG